MQLSINCKVEIEVYALDMIQLYIEIVKIWKSETETKVKVCETVLQTNMKT